MKIAHRLRSIVRSHCMISFRYVVSVITRFYYISLDSLLAPKMERNHILSKNSIRMRDSASVAAVLAKVFDAGPDYLQIVTDFDYTISKPSRTDGSANCTTHGVFDSIANGLQPALKGELRALRDKYYPIEIDPSLSADEKLPHMKTWWEMSHGLISAAGFNKKTIERYVHSANVELRDGAVEFLRLTEQANIPVIIFSAGIGDLIEMILRQRYGSIPSNLHIISNMMEFNNSDTVVGFKPPLIHTFNKNCSVIENERPFFERLKGRPNVVLLGDTLGDLNMDVGVVIEKVILKIGFLNQKVNESLPVYMAGYDVVLAEDPTFDVPLDILKGVVAQRKSFSP